MWIVVWNRTGGYDLKAMLKNIVKSKDTGEGVEFENACMEL